jgi:uridine monophosphate synthetase
MMEVKMGFFSRLEERVRQSDSLLCVGLDPHIAELTEPTVDAARDFCLRLVDATADLAAAYKPNMAFFEVFGADGLRLLAEIIAALPPGVPVILDAKRGDIASTAQAYAQAAFQTLGADAITLSPYLGHDSLTPFLQDPERGVFLLCKTSNPGSADLQDLPIACSPAGLKTAGSYTVYETVALLARQWNVNDNLGLVVGATHPDALARVRLLAPELWILAPGVGAQGGDLPAALRAGLRSDGTGLLVPISRALSQSDDPRHTALDLCHAINRHRQAFHERAASAPVAAPALVGSLAELADGLLDAGCVKFGQFTLKSGLLSPIYLDLRLLVGFPRLLEQVACAYLPLLRSLSFDRLAALPYAALPIGAAVSLQGNWPMIYPRKEVKAYGTQAEIEGVFVSGERVVVIDDLATTGGSKFEAIDRLVAAGLQVGDVVVLIDRQSGAAAALDRAGYRLHSVFTLTQLLDYWHSVRRVSSDQIAAARQFLKEGALG